jgi:gamma-glutamyltranspeptidase/glutathione hydrolase
LHLLAEASRLAFADRNRYLADPDFVTTPVSGLLDRTYLDQRRALIDQITLSEATAGTPPNTPGRKTRPWAHRHEPYLHR